MKFNDTHLPVTIISQDGRDLLLNFIIGNRYIVGRYLQRVRDAYSLGVDSKGELTVIARSRRNYSDEKDKRDFTFLKNPDVQARLRHLNQKGIIDIIFPRRDKTAKAPPMTLTLETISVSTKHKDLAKISFFEGSDWKVLGLQKIDDKWQAGRVWKWHKYHEVKIGHSDGGIFRTKDGEIRK